MYDFLFFSTSLLIGYYDVYLDFYFEEQHKGLLCPVDLLPLDSYSPSFSFSLTDIMKWAKYFQRIMYNFITSAHSGPLPALCRGFTFKAAWLWSVLRRVYNYFRYLANTLSFSVLPICPWHFSSGCLQHLHPVLLSVFFRVTLKWIVSFPQ